MQLNSKVLNYHCQSLDPHSYKSYNPPLYLCPAFLFLKICLLCRCHLESFLCNPGRSFPIAPTITIFQRRCCLHDKVRKALDGILDQFKSGELTKSIALAVFPRCIIPSSQWSLLNRVIMYSNDTNDARGFRQWKEVGRYVKKGSKSFCILAPKMKKKTSRE